MQNLAGKLQPTSGAKEVRVADYIAEQKASQPPIALYQAGAYLAKSLDETNK